MWFGNLDMVFGYLAINAAFWFLAMCIDFRRALRTDTSDFSVFLCLMATLSAVVAGYAVLAIKEEGPWSHIGLGIGIAIAAGGAYLVLRAVGSDLLKPSSIIRKKYIRMREYFSHYRN